jgi:hypothetical protein
VAALAGATVVRLRGRRQAGTGPAGRGTAAEEAAPAGGGSR